jgi:hypothetical protein
MRNLLLLSIAGLVMIAALHRWGPGPFGSSQVRAARALWRSGDAEGARRAASSALPGLRREVDGMPTDVERRLALAEALALAGERERGLAEARRAAAADPAPWAERRQGDLVHESPLETLAVVATEAGDDGQATAARQASLAHTVTGVEPVRR